MPKTVLAPRLYTLLAMLVTVGCGSDRVPLAEVAGAVTLDGKPLAGAEVQFVPEPGQGLEAPRSTGRSDDQGRFKLACDDGRSGAMLGPHRVVVQDLKAYGGSPAFEDKHSVEYERGAGPPAPKFRFNQVYADLSRTPLRKEVNAGKQTIDIELKSRP